MNFVPLVEPARAEPRLEGLPRTARRARTRRSSRSSRRRTRRRTQRLDELASRVGRGCKRPSLPPDLPGGYAVDRGKADRCRRSSGGAIRTVPGAVVPARRASVRVPGRRAAAAVGVRRAAAGSSWRDWLTQPGHPLTARVMVNRIWQHHFGRGIVATPSNFGVRGEPPTHPELLDWLAADGSSPAGWSIKAMHREIVLSETYQLAERPRRARRRARPRQPLALAVPPPAARRRVDPRRHARRLRQASTDPAGPASVPADRGLALDPARRRSRRSIPRTTAAST